jgi:prevent-host-death family protein
MDSNRKGAIAEAAVALEAIKLGIPVLKPVAEHGRYDLGFELGGRILRVQCKWGGLEDDGSVIKVALQSNCLTPAGYVRSPYGLDEIDCVAVYCQGLDRCYLLPSAVACGRTAIWLRLTPPRNGQRACINLASDFEFAGAVAQLEEHRHGMAGARGSSPLSSTPTSVDVGCHEFRNHFGYYLERAAAGEEIRISRRGRPYARLVPAEPVQPKLAAA